MNREEDLGVVDGRHVTVEAGGESVSITPLTVAQLPDYLALVDIVLPTVREHGPSVAILAREHQAEIVRLVELATRRPRTWIDELPLDEFARLASAAVEINLDFFAHSLLPELVRMQEAMTRAMAPLSDGPTLSSDSLSQGTDMVM